MVMTLLFQSVNTIAGGMDFLAIGKLLESEKDYKKLFYEVKNEIRYFCW
jgi:hypothetical protein